MTPADAASVVMFRVLFGLLVAAAALRFLAKGWVGEHFTEPQLFFPYWGFEWVRPLSQGGMTALYGALALAGVAVAAGAFYRVAMAVVFALFTYAHLVDQTYYLNHYYLVSCLAFLGLCLPLASSGSVDALRKTGNASASTVPSWVLWSLRAQVGFVYFFAGVAKLKPDWLFHAEPLRIWLAANADLPVIGGLLEQRWAPPLMSWTGAAFDLCVVPLLLWKRSRAIAYAALVGFHVLTAVLFPLGMFPWIMSLVTLVFFEPGWPRKIFGGLSVLRGSASLDAPRPALPSQFVVATLAVYFAVQLFMPLRHVLYPGDVSWTEEGFRYSWSVMLLEKNGSVELTVKEPDSGRTWSVSPRDYLTPFQTKMMSAQADMILTYAHHVGRDFERRGVKSPQVFADVFVSWNGRPAARFVDPSVDLYRERESLAPKHWILPAPRDPPP